MKHYLKTVALILALSILLLALSACIRAGWFNELSVVKRFPNSRWESKDGKMTLFLRANEPYSFGCIVKDGEKIPFLFESWLYGECRVQSFVYFDGEKTSFDWDKTIDQKPSFYLAADSRYYWDGDKDLTLTFDEPEKAADLGLPAKITLYLKEQDIPAEDIEKEFPPINLPPHYDLYDDYLAIRKMTYDDVSQTLGVCEKYSSSYYSLYCYYPVKTESGELLYWSLRFSASGSLDSLALIAPEDIFADAITVDKSGSYRMPPLPSPS